MKISHYLSLFFLMFIFSSCATSSYPKAKVTSMQNHIVIYSPVKKRSMPNRAIKEPIDLRPYLSYISQKLSSLRGAAVYPDQSLQLAAEHHAKDMALNNHFSHRGSGRETDVAREYNGKGSRFLERIVFFGYKVHSRKPAGEVIAYSKGTIVGDFNVIKHFDHAIENFLKSPLHAKIILNRNFRYFGIGAYRVNNTIYWVIDFAQ